MGPALGSYDSSFLYQKSEAELHSLIKYCHRVPYIYGYVQAFGKCVHRDSTYKFFSTNFSILTFLCISENLWSTVVFSSLPRSYIASSYIVHVQMYCTK